MVIVPKVRQHVRVRRNLIIRKIAKGSQFKDLTRSGHGDLFKLMQEICGIYRELEWKWNGVEVEYKWNFITVLHR